MLSFARVATALVVVGTVVNAAIFPRATKKCTTIDSGYINTLIGSEHSLDIFRLALWHNQASAHRLTSIERLCS